MKKTSLIIGGIAAILLLLAIWVYLLIYGTPKPVEEFFTDFSFGGSSENIDDTPFVPSIENEQVDVVGGVPLRQLTTKAVVGFGEKQDITSNDKTIMYVEAGTGHVYAINLATGAETRLSNTTITNAESASFSPDGSKVVIRSGYGTINTIELLTLNGENNATKETLTQRMVDFRFNNQNKLYYTEYNQVGLLARELDTDTKTSRTLFSVPFQNATVFWSQNSNIPHFTYPKPSAKLSGFLYQIKDGTLKREVASGNGLVALANNSYFIHTVTTAQGPISYATERTRGTVNLLPIVAQPDKCIFDTTNDNTLYCGFEEANLNYEFPDNWYKGLVSFSDAIWEIDLNKGLAAKLINPKNDTGREIDIIDMNISGQNRVLYFINKNDNTLWMYEI